MGRWPRAAGCARGRPAGHVNLMYSYKEMSFQHLAPTEITRARLWGFSDEEVIEEGLVFVETGKIWQAVPV